MIRRISDHRAFALLLVAASLGASVVQAAPQTVSRAKPTTRATSVSAARATGPVAAKRLSKLAAFDRDAVPRVERSLGGPVMRLAQFDARREAQRDAQNRETREREARDGASAPSLGGAAAPSAGNVPAPDVPLVPGVTYAGATDQKLADPNQPPPALGAAPFDLGRIQALQVGTQMLAEAPLRVGNLDVLAPLVDKMATLGATVSKADPRLVPDIPALGDAQWFQINVPGREPTVLQIGKATAWIGKVEQPLRAAPFNVNGELWLPVFSIAPLVGAATRLDARGTLVLTPTVQSVELFPVKDRVVAVTIKTSAPVPAGAWKMVTVRTGGKPKIYIDFKGFSMGFDAENTTLERIVGRETGDVSIVRAAQPQFFPDVTRVVLDLKKPLVATVQKMNDPTLFALVLTDTSRVVPPQFPPRVRAPMMSDAPLRGWRIVVDPGHGGKDTGARGKRSYEKQHTLDISRRLARQLSERGATVFLTREGDTYPSLQGRVDFAHRQEADLFISVHMNSNVSSKPSGTQTFFYTGISRPLASYIHSEFVPATGRANRGITQTKHWVTSRTRMPAVLLEVAFISNAAEEAKMMDANWREGVARGVAQGISRYSVDFPLDPYSD